MGATPSPDSISLVIRPATPLPWLRLLALPSILVVRPPRLLLILPFVRSRPMRPEEQAAAVETLRRLHAALADGQTVGNAAWWVYASGRAPEPVVSCSATWLRRRAADCWLIEVKVATKAPDALVHVAATVSPHDGA